MLAARGMVRGCSLRSQHRAQEAVLGLPGDFVRGKAHQRMSPISANELGTSIGGSWGQG